MDTTEAQDILSGRYTVPPSAVRRVEEVLAMAPTRHEKCNLEGCEERSEVENSIDIPLTAGWLAEGTGGKRKFYCSTAHHKEYKRQAYMASQARDSRV